MRGERSELGLEAQLIIDQMYLVGSYGWKFILDFSILNLLILQERRADRSQA